MTGFLYLGGFVLGVLALLTDSWVLALTAVVVFIFAFINEPEYAHIDPPDTRYMDRAGVPAGREE